MRFHFWHTILLLFYVAVAFLAYAWLSANGKLASFVPVGDFILMTLAIQRLVRLFTYDAITQFVRDWFAGADSESLRGSLGTLVNCPWCTGLWFALVVAFFYFATPVIAWYAILVLALASAGSLFQLFANYLGWSAEGRKRECQSIALPR
jgi:hypothetical protein